MDQKTKEEYQEFANKFSGHYSSYLGGTRVIGMDSLFTGFVNHRSIIEPGRFIIGLNPFHSIPEPHSRTYQRFLQKQNLDLTIARNIVHAYAEVDSKIIPEYLERTGIKPRHDFGYLINDLILNGDLPENPNKNPIQEDYTKTKNIIQDRSYSQVHLIPHNFPDLDVEEYHQKLIQELFGKNAKLLNISNHLMLTDNSKSELISLYDWLQQAPKDQPFFTTDHIC